ncbi:MAG TPA: hypothetical protein VKU84_05760, partial [Stellaceae bacterium]|nr:hypothetical protein [Stellaceae bacterium]
ILDDPPDVASFIAHVMTGGAAGLPKGIESRIVRMNPLISPVKVAGIWTAPGDLTAAQFTHLADLDMDAIAQPDVDAISELADLWLKDEARNQPIRMDGDTLQREVGPDRFSGALAAWQALTSPPAAAGGAGV